MRALRACGSALCRISVTLVRTCNFSGSNLVNGMKQPYFA